MPSSDDIRCPSTYVTKSTWKYTDIVQCEKPKGHKSKQHSFHYIGPLEGQIETWTDQEVRDE